MNESLLQKLKMVKLRDVGHVFLFLLALLPAFFYRLHRPHLWLVCESADEARDNGYWFFKYLRKQRPDVDAVYAVNPAAPEAARVRALGPTVPFGGFRHWVYYLAAEVNISSQKYGKPNAAVCYVLEVVLGILKNRRVFLQHGVILHDLPFLHRNKARYALFCCGAEPEYRFVREHFGYEPSAVCYTGLCRFDGLHGGETERDLLLILPTWRMALQRLHGETGQKAFLQSDYYRRWSELLQSPGLQELLERYDKRAVFVAHRNMQAYEACFTSAGDRVRVLPWAEADVASLIRRAGAVLTDYSSVQMDFGYQFKSVLCYQFDEEQFHREHLQRGYFDSLRNGFGPVCATQDELLGALEEQLRADFVMPPLYADRVRAFYPLNDDANSERTYLAIRRLLDESAPGREEKL